MEIYLTESDSQLRFRFPMLPESINVKTSARFASYNLMGLGEIKLPSSENLTGFSWEGILPGEKRLKEAGENAVPYLRTSKYTESEPSENISGDLQEYPGAHETQRRWSRYRLEGVKLRLLITETPVYHDVYLEFYDIIYKEGYGDYHYNISFVCAKDLTIDVIPPVVEEVEEEAKIVTHKKTSLNNPLPLGTLAASFAQPTDNIWEAAQRTHGDGSKYMNYFEYFRSTNFDADEELVNRVIEQLGQDEITVKEAMQILDHDYTKKAIGR